MQDAPRKDVPEEDSAPVKIVLIIEDDGDIGEALTAIIQDATASQAVHVSDGFAALKVVRTLTPQLILLDYQLAAMDGSECLDKLRESKGVEQTPVILMSAALPKKARERSDLTFLEKPFEMNALLDLIKQVLETSS